MVPEEPSDMLEQARQDAMLSIGSLWLRYFELGGMGTALELEAYLCGALVPSPHENDACAPRPPAHSSQMVRSTAKVAGAAVAALMRGYSYRTMASDRLLSEVLGSSRAPW
jgi:hypothetical protein